ncbi:glutamate-rich protein 3 isoform X1 [Pygocentrus nattereri]|uniref:glutamate-rich protein 3 isoform X1 n=1 Tax=Pygocentrus nattereri TaxID=42514 RepID=UPI001891E752|nr:glutamate-rich protein 3 isoform X1 [Pygocentrus nattereri]
MSHPNPGLLGAYNSLTDKHLTGYFNNTRIRRHLQKVGLLSRSGRIIPEKEYRHKLIQRAHQRHIRECLAQAIFHKVLDLERLHQIEIKRKLEEFARRERVHKIKVECSNRYEEDPIMMLSPRPPTGPKNSHARQSGLEVEHSESTESPGSSRPNTAPGKMQRPVRLKPLNSTSTPGSLKRNSSRHRHQDSSNETDHPFSSPLERDAARHLTLTDFSSTVSPYRLPVINNFVTPVPPLTKRKEKGPKANGTLRGRRLRPTTAPSAADTQEGTMHRASAQSAVSVKMIYFGKSVHLSHDLMDLKDEVKVFQQHCGGENLCVYKGRLNEGETFHFVSRRHRGFPFSLTFFLNGLQVERLSSCCEFKHRKGSRLGGRHGHFGFTGVEGASPCYRCIIAMGLDKKPTPPKRVKEDPLLSTSRGTSKDDEEDEEEEKPDLSQPQETDTKGDGKAKNDYEEDFEADDEGPVEDGADEGNETTPSPTREDEEESGKKDENENEVTEKKQDSDSEAGDSDKSKVKRSSSVSSLSSTSSSSEEDESEDGPEPDDEKDVPEGNVEPERHVSTLTSEKDTKVEETEAMETSSVSLPQQTEEESQTQDSLKEKSEVEISEDTERDDGEGAAEDHVKAEDERKEVEPEKAKSVQEKLADAILNVAECSSEPELSDTTTEEDEVASVMTQQDSPGAEPESEAAQSPSEGMSKENVAEPLEPALEFKTVEGDANTEQPMEELEKETEKPPQPESTPQEEEMSAEVNEDTNEQQEKERDEQPVGEEQNDSAVMGAETDDKEQEEEKEELEKEEDKANEDPEMAGKLDNKKMEECNAEESLAPEKEVESQDTTNAEESGDTPAEEQELAQTGEDLEVKDVITEPQPEDPRETAVIDTKSVGDADDNTNQDTEIKSQEQTEHAENGGEGTGEEASAEDEVKEEVRADEEEAVGELDGEEKDDTDEMRGAKITEGTEEPEEGSLADGVRMMEEEGEEKDGEETIRDDLEQQISMEAEVSENNLEISEEGNTSEEKQVEDIVENAEDAVNDGGQKETESTLDKDAEGEDESKTGENCKDTDDVEPEEAGKETESVKEDEPKGGERTEKESVEKAEDKDYQGGTETMAEKDAEVKDESRSNSGNKPEEGVKEHESAKEDEPDDGEQPVKETELEDQSGDVAEEVENSADNNANEHTEVNVEESVAISEDKGGEEKTEDGDGGDEVEVKEGLAGTNLEETKSDQEPETEPETEKVEARNNVAQEIEERKEDEEIVQEEVTEDSENTGEQIPAREGSLEVNQTENKPEEMEVEDKVEKPKDDASDREPESPVDKDAEAEGESKSSGDADNNTTEEELKDNGSIKVNETDDEGYPDMDDKEGGEENTEVVEAQAELQEGEENYEMEQEEDNEQKEDSKPALSDGLQEATVGSEVKAGEMDTETGEKVEGVNEKKEPPAKSEGEAMSEDGKEETIQTETEQYATNEGVKDEQEYDKEKEVEKASSNADAEAEVPSDAKTAPEEPADPGSEMKGTETDLENGAKEASIADDNQAGLTAFEETEQDGATEDDTPDGEGSSSPASPSEESQPAEKVMALKREDRESAFSEDAELLATPPADQGDLVSNWVNIHQTSRYFETFVEPLDDIKSLISHEGERKVNGEAVEEEEETKHQNAKDSESGGMDKTSEAAKDEQVKSDLENLEDTLVESFKTESKAEALESDASSNQSKDTASRSAKNILEDQDDTEAQDIVPYTESFFTSGDLQAVPVDNILNLSETPVTKFEISQDS